MSDSLPNMTCEKENGREFFIKFFQHCDGEMRPSLSRGKNMCSTSFLALPSLVATNQPPLCFFFTKALYIMNSIDVKVSHLFIAVYIIEGLF